MNWKAELEFELTDAAEIVSHMQTSVLRSDTLRPEIVAHTGQLKRRADVIITPFYTRIAR